MLALGEATVCTSSAVVLQVRHSHFVVHNLLGCHMQVHARLEQLGAGGGSGGKEEEGAAGLPPGQRKRRKLKGGVRRLCSLRIVRFGCIAAWHQMLASVN